MGRLIEIDVDKLKELINDNKIELTNNIISIVRENYIPKADFENRLKAEVDRYINDHNKIEKIAAIIKTAKADPTRDEYAEYYLDAIEEVIRWTPI